MFNLDTPLILQGRLVKLIPLELSQFDALHEAAQDKNIWANFIYDGSIKDKLFAALQNSLTLKATGEQYPFVVIDNSTGKPIGCTRYMDIQPAHKKLEIGGTWYNPAYWGSGVNIECKLLLLTYAFETLDTVRVYLKTNETNTRSRKAMEKIGAKFEGILRKDMILPTGLPRNNTFYSIIDDEWPAVKTKLTEMLQNIGASSPGRMSPGDMFCQ